MYIHLNQFNSLSDDNSKANSHMFYNHLYCKQALCQTCDVRGARQVQQGIPSMHSLCCKVYDGAFAAIAS
jgi:hypothetical protein